MPLPGLPVSMEGPLMCASLPYPSTKREGRLWSKPEIQTHHGRVSHNRADPKAAQFGSCRARRREEWRSSRPGVSHSKSGPESANATFFLQSVKHMSTLHFEWIVERNWTHNSPRLPSLRPLLKERRRLNLFPRAERAERIFGSCARAMAYDEIEGSAAGASRRSCRKWPGEDRPAGAAR